MKERCSSSLHVPAHHGLSFSCSLDLYKSMMHGAIGCNTPCQKMHTVCYPEIVCYNNRPGELCFHSRLIFVAGYHFLLRVAEVEILSQHCDRRLSTVCGDI